MSNKLRSTVFSLGALVACDLTIKQIGDEADDRDDPACDESEGEECANPPPCEGGEPVPGDECEYCVCADDGTAQCESIPGCEPDPGPRPGPQPRPAPPEAECSFESSDIVAQDGCNICRCTLEGIVECNNECAPEPDCEDGKIIEDGCYMCTCDAAVGYACELVCGCAPGTSVPSPDGCNECICDENGELSCTELACDPGDPGQVDPGTVAVCEEGTADTDAFDVLDAEFAVDVPMLLLEVANSGCNPYPAFGCWGGEWAESFPVQTTLAVARAQTPPQDECDAYFTQTIGLDLQPILDSYIESYGETGSFVLNLEGFGALEYTF